MYCPHACLTLRSYLSASWCPPCRQFTPTLADWVKDHAARFKARALFVSGDGSAAEAAAYNSKMGFPMAPFSKTAFQNLMSNWGLKGIPSLVVLRIADGKVMTKNGRSKLETAPEGFPWQAPEGEEEVEGGGVLGLLGPLGLLLLLAWTAYKLLNTLGFL